MEGNTWHCENTQFLLKLSPINCATFQWILPATILTVVFAYWWFCGSLIPSVFINWNHFIRKSCFFSPVCLFPHWLNEYLLYFIGYNPELLLFTLLLKLSQLRPLGALCGINNGLEGARRSVRKGIRQIKQDSGFTMVAWTKIAAVKIERGRRLWMIFRQQNGWAFKTNWMWDREMGGEGVYVLCLDLLRTQDYGDIAQEKS